MSDIFVVENLKRSFKASSGTIHALRGISLSISAQGFSAFCGRSGSGKTTLMNLLGTLDSPDEGRILFNGAYTGGMSENMKNSLRRRQIGFVYQSVALMPQMTAFENVEFSLRVSGYPLRQRRERVEECLEMVGLAKRMTHMSGELSGGEQQRVAIARAIAHKPAVIFADEPTAELDTSIGLHIVKMFRRLIEKERVTVIMSTHDLNLLEYVDCVYKLQDGEIVDE